MAAIRTRKTLAFRTGRGNGLAAFILFLKKALGAAAIERIRPGASAASKTLGEALRVREGSRGNVSVGVPHFWARWLHDGRKAAHAKPGHMLIWFRDTRDDPRLRNGYPIAPNDVLHLTREGVRQASLMARADPERVFFRKVSGPKTGKPFMRDGLAGFGASEGEALALNLLDEFVRENAPSEKAKASGALKI